MATPLNPREVWGVVLWIVYPILIGIIDGICMMYADWKDWYEELKKSPRTPKDWVFSVVWLVLYLAMSAAGALVYTMGDPDDSVMQVALAFHFVQLLLNSIWTPIFFFGHRIQLAMIDITATFILALVAAILSAIIYPWTLFLYIPYLSWLAFAGGDLNFYIVMHNEVEAHDEWFDTRSNMERRQDLEALSGESKKEQQ